MVIDSIGLKGVWMCYTWTYKYITYLRQGRGYKKKWNTAQFYVVIATV